VLGKPYDVEQLLAALETKYRTKEKSGKQIRGFMG
jgi:hypothetical protein